MWQRIRNWLTEAFKGYRRAVFIVDGAALLPGRTSGRLAPKEQIQILRKLAIFASRENSKVICLFEGRPLREVSDGGEFAPGVRVFFAPDPVTLERQMKDLLGTRRSRRKVAVVGNAKLERELSTLGCRLIRGNTFRKAVELTISIGDSSQSSTAHATAGRAQSGTSRRKREKSGKAESARKAQGGHSDTDTAQRIEENAQTGTEGSKVSSSAVDTEVRKLIDLVE